MFYSFNLVLESFKFVFKKRDLYISVINLESELNMDYYFLMELFVHYLCWHTLLNSHCSIILHITIPLKSLRYSYLACF